MIIRKEFRWEMGHRLPLHEGACRNLHGHSYRLEVEIEGAVDTRTGMVVDFGDISSRVKPLVAELDHCFLLQDTDAELLDYLRRNQMKHRVLPVPPTVENICGLFAEALRPFCRAQSGVTAFRLRIHETPTSCALYAETVR